MFPFSNSDKLLIVAPHPDDESLATGGLLQRAFASEVPVRILFGTKGENNPWAQRFWERRWNIGRDERAGWGERRRQEALNAISVLGGKPDCARFLNLPDQGITGLLMKGAQELLALFAEEIEEWRPTLVVIPAMRDAHPDHSALSVMLSMVLDSFGGLLGQVWEYLVHEPQVAITRQPVTLRLSSEEVEGKQQAILCHETQVALSRRRFTRFSKVEEAYYLHNPTGFTSDDGSVLAARAREGVLNLLISADWRDRLGSQILLAFRSSATELNCWRIPLSFRSRLAPIWDASNGLRLHDATATWCRSGLTVRIPLIGMPNFDAVFVKLSGWTLFFDRSGWCQASVTSGRASILANDQRWPV
jgi:LmbE family N-acetylglucosaminyl deacetylase